MIMLPIQTRSIVEQMQLFVVYESIHQHYETLVRYLYDDSSWTLRKCHVCDVKSNICM